MSNIIYPAVFHKTKNNSFRVEFPDLPGCFSVGDSLTEAFHLAGDALFAWTDIFQNLPAPTDITKIETSEGDFVSLIKAEPYGDH